MSHITEIANSLYLADIISTYFVTELESARLFGQSVQQGLKSSKINQLFIDAGSQGSNFIIHLMLLRLAADVSRR